MSQTLRLTTAQALVRFLAVQHSERDGVRHRLIEGVFGIFGHGNVAGIGQALLQEGSLPYYQARNEQAMVHAAVAYARTRNRLSTLACTTSIGPGATNLVTGAALATINRLPVLLLPGDVFATGRSGTVLQQLEPASSLDVTVNDALRPVSAFFTRIWRPEQLPAALLAAMRVLTDPAQTGAVTIALPQDVQAEALDWPVELFADRVWRVPRAAPEPAVLQQVLELIRSSHRPLLVAGGGVAYSAAWGQVQRLAEATGIPVAQTQAGYGVLPHDHPQSVGGLGVTGSTVSAALARRADLVLGVGTRWTDFSTGSQSLFADPQVRFVNINVHAPDAAKLAGVGLLADARAALEALSHSLVGWSVSADYRGEVAAGVLRWRSVVQTTVRVPDDQEQARPTQAHVIGLVNEVAGPRDVALAAAGSLPGDLHRVWRPQDPQGYHVEYGYSCMGYEIAGGVGAAMGAPDRRIFVLVGDGSYLMMSSEIVTAVELGLSLVIVLVDNHGYASIGALSQSLGSGDFGTQCGGPVDLGANAASLGAQVVRAHTVAQVRAGLQRAAVGHGVWVVHVECPQQPSAPPSGVWWDVPVAVTSSSPATRAARVRYDEAAVQQRHHLRPSDR